MFVSWRVTMDSWYFKNMSKEYTPDLTKHMPSLSKHTPICLICSFGCWIHVWYVPHLDMWSVSVCQAMCIMDFPFASLVPNPRCCFRPECERLESESQLCESGSDRFVFVWLFIYFWPWQHNMHSRESTCWVPGALEALDLFRSQLQFNTFLCFGQLDCNVYIYIYISYLPTSMSIFVFFLSFFPSSWEL